MRGYRVCDLSLCSRCAASPPPPRSTALERSAPPLCGTPLFDSRPDEGFKCDIFGLTVLAVGFVPRIVVLGGVLDVYEFGPVVGVAEEAVRCVGLVVKDWKGDVDIISRDT